MAFERPTLSQLIERITSDISSRIIGSATALRRSVIKVIGTVLGGAVYLLYGFLDYIALESMPDTAVDNLERWASIWEVSKNGATYATGSATFPGTNGTILPALTIVQRGDGVEYQVQNDGTVSGGTVSVDLLCLTPGDTGNMLSGESLTIVTAIAGITSQGTVDIDGISGGSDEESLDSLRARMLQKIQEPPQGGSKTDYEQWAKSITGVTRVWVYENQYGAGTVGVAFVRDNDTPSIIPSAGEIATVQDYIDTVRPLTADVTVWAPVAVARNFTIQLVTNDTAAIRAAVEAELRDLILRESEPGGTLLLSHIREAVSKAAGETDSIVTVPAANAAAGAGNIYIMGTITWV